MNNCLDNETSSSQASRNETDLASSAILELRARVQEPSSGPSPEPSRNKRYETMKSYAPNENNVQNDQIQPNRPVSAPPVNPRPMRTAPLPPSPLTSGSRVERPSSSNTGSGRQTTRPDNPRPSTSMGTRTESPTAEPPV